MKLTYTPDSGYKVHPEGTIDLLCRAFQSHEAGLPEWPKNAADEYIRQNVQEENRVIAIVFRSGTANRSGSISCLDCCGITSNVIEEHFRHWGSPEAARQSSRPMDIQGGHGNGGKCYAIKMFEDCSILHTVKNGLGNRYGVAGGSNRFGYVPNEASGKDYIVDDIEKDLKKALEFLGIALVSLPKEVTSIIKTSKGFTLMSGVRPRGLEGRIPAKRLIQELQEHPQMIRTLELCKVFVVFDGKVLNDGKPLSVKEIKPLEGAEKPLIINIPTVLKDPRSGQKVSTTESGKYEAGTLTLRTSNVNLSRKVALHKIVFKAQSGYVGFVPVSALDIQSEYRNHIFGLCNLNALEQLKTNDRAKLADSPLSRAVERFIATQVQTYAREFENRDRRQYNQDEKNAISRMNDALDRWKNRFLKETLRGLSGPGIGKPEREITRLPAGKVAKIELNLSHNQAGIGVSLTPGLKFFDPTGQIIRAVPYKWVSEDTNVAMIDEERFVINTFAPGVTTLYAQTKDEKITSNKVSLEVVSVREIKISPDSIEVPAGSRRKAVANCVLVNGHTTAGVYLVWTESDSNIASVGPSGVIFAYSTGEVDIIAGDDNCVSPPAKIRVLAAAGKGTGNERSSGFPRVLVSGEIQRDPDTNEYVYFTPDDPPIAQRPKDVDRNIFWINSASPLAHLFLDKSKGYGFETEAWRMYHIERFVDVIVQIILKQTAEAENLSASQWLLKAGFQEAEVQAAAVADLLDFLKNGEVPSDEREE